jgi:hypothetical protein
MFGREPPAQTNYTTLITVCNPVHYLLFTYIVTSKPKRISVAAGLVHMILLLIYNKQKCLCGIFCDLLHATDIEIIMNFL